MKYRYTVTANSSEPEIYHDGNLLVFAKARCDYEYIPKDEETISEQTLPLTCWQKAIRIGNILLDTSPYWVSILYALVCLYSAFADPGKYIVTVAFLFYSLFELVLEIFEQKLELYGIKRQITILLLLFIALVFGIFVVPAYPAIYNFANDNGTIFQALSLLFIFTYQFIGALEHQSCRNHGKDSINKNAK